MVTGRGTATGVDRGRSFGIGRVVRRGADISGQAARLGARGRRIRTNVRAGIAQGTADIGPRADITRSAERTTGAGRIAERATDGAAGRTPGACAKELRLGDGRTQAERNRQDDARGVWDYGFHVVLSQCARPELTADDR